MNRAISLPIAWGGGRFGQPEAVHTIFMCIISAGKIQSSLSALNMKVNFSRRASELPVGVYKLSILLSVFVIVFKISIKMIRHCKVLKEPNFHIEYFLIFFMV
jgi:hypothetical protein